VNRILPLVFGLLALAAAPSHGRAEWGWPPPGYSVTGVSFCDGSHYRGLCAVLRDWRHRACPGGVPASPAPFDPGASSFPATPGAPASPHLPAQPPTPSGGPRP
jgi:hypothetical protein